MVKHPWTHLHGCWKHKADRLIYHGGAQASINLESQSSLVLLTTTAIDNANRVSGLNFLNSTMLRLSRGNKVVVTAAKKRNSLGVLQTVSDGPRVPQL